MRTDDPLADASLSDYAAAADVSVRGAIVDREDGVQVAEGLPAYTLLTIKPSEVVQGLPPDPLKVLVLTQTDDGRPIAVEGRPEFSQEESVWLLDSVAPEFGRPDEFVLAGNSGVIPGNAQGEVQIDVIEETVALAEAQQIGDLDGVVDALRE